MVKLKFLTVAAVNIFILLVSSEDECSANLKNGTVIGLLTGTLNPFKKVCAFMAIPYAQPPVAQLRFMV